jgi:AcrR family transcriptional regulator
MKGGTGAVRAKSAPAEPGSADKSARQQLGRQDWVQAGLRTLAAGGIEGVRVEALARDLNVSKGSFYWHFGKREDLLGAMLDTWELQEIDWMLNQAERGEAAERWGKLVELVGGSGYSALEAAVFDWAQKEPEVAARVRAVEERRVGYIAEVLEDIGFEEREAQWWGEAVYQLYLGWVNRAQRNSTMREGQRSVGHFLSRLVLAAAALEGQAVASPRKR